mmetsp:Transcript_2877/g.6060  ORF Transcript_2877/g.6060 Transcript_2877/m.6060 type:complete len:301 (+) Transcript_2877:486-1388(+)
MVMRTSCSSMPATSMLYSMDTFICPRDSSSGQQLIFRGTRSSEVPAYVHFRMPTGLALGNPLVGSLSCSRPVFSYMALFTLGCVLNEKMLSRLVGSFSWTAHRAASSSAAVSVRLPLISNSSTMPSRERVADTFSTIASVMGCCATEVVTGALSEVPDLAPLINGASLSSRMSASSAALFLAPAGTRDMPLTAGLLRPLLPLGIMEVGTGSANAEDVVADCIDSTRLLKSEPPPPIPAIPPPLPPRRSCSFCLSLMDRAAAMAWSLADSILLILIMLCSFSSWLSISMLVRICCRVMGSR